MFYFFNKLKSMISKVYLQIILFIFFLFFIIICLKLFFLSNEDVEYNVPVDVAIESRGD